MREDFERLANTSLGHSKNNAPKRKDRRKAKLNPEEATDARSPSRMYGWDYHDRRRNRRWDMPQKWLESQVGRPWNDIYSEVCARVKDPELRKQFCWHMDGWKMFVDAEGILRKRKDRPRWRRDDRLPDGIVLSDNVLVQYHKIKEIWYEVQFRKPTPDEIKRKHWGRPSGASHSITGRWTPTWHPLFQQVTPLFDFDDLSKTSRQFGQPIFPVAKRQISSKEIAKLGLRNRSKK